MGPLQYYPGLWNRAALAIMGLVVIAVALISGALALSRHNALAERGQALADGISMGLGIGLAGGIGFLYLQTRTGGPSFFLAPYDFRAGLLSGLMLGGLAALALGTFIALRSAGVIGLLVGTLAGLAVFRLIFGPTAGFGGEVGFGVGREVGIMFGTAGGLLGGITAQAVALATRHNTMRRSPSDAALDDPSPTRPGWRWPLIALALGGLAAALIGALGAEIGVFQFLVPYNAQVPDVPPDTSSTAMLHNLLFGLGLFAVGGALIGCFLGLQWMASRGTGARRPGVWRGAGLVVALLCGLSFGLAHRYIGGPLLNAPRVPPDPAAGVRGLAIGLIGGAALGILLLVLGRISRRDNNARWHRVVEIAIALSVGLLTVALPYWFTPLFAISIH